MTDLIARIHLPGEPAYLLTHRVATGAQLPGFASPARRVHTRRAKAASETCVKGLAKAVTRV